MVVVILQMFVEKVKPTWDGGSHGPLVMAVEANGSHCVQ